MEIAYSRFAPDDRISLAPYAKDRKIAKYANRESLAAIVVAGTLSQKHPFHPSLPVYFATALPEMEDLGFCEMAFASRDEKGKFSNERYIEKGILEAVPLYQLKIIHNTTLSLVSMNFGLTGEHAVIHTEAGMLLAHAVAHPVAETLLLGAGKIHGDNSVECGFALIDRDKLRGSEWLGSEAPAVEMFRSWSEGGPL